MSTSSRNRDATEEDLMTRLWRTQFDTKIIQLHEGTPIEEVAEITDEQYRPGGMAALQDAVGLNLLAVEKRYQEVQVKPDAIFCAIITDGEENSSEEYTGEQIKQMIEERQANPDWKISFIGAEQTAWIQGERLGVHRDSIMSTAPQDTAATMRMMSNDVRAFTSSKKKGRPQN